jgi:hypothetical protein
MIADKDLAPNIGCMHSPFNSRKPDSALRGEQPALKSRWLLDAVKLERARYPHLALRTEEVYVYWVRHFVTWHGRRHPRNMGGPEVAACLTMLATQRQVPTATHRQALSGILFLYREVLCWKLPTRRVAHGKRRFCYRFRNQGTSGATTAATAPAAGSSRSSAGCRSPAHAPARPGRRGCAAWLLLRGWR